MGLEVMYLEVVGYYDDTQWASPPKPKYKVRKTNDSLLIVHLIYSISPSPLLIPGASTMTTIFRIPMLPPTMIPVTGQANTME